MAITRSPNITVMPIKVPAILFDRLAPGGRGLKGKEPFFTARADDDSSIIFPSVAKRQTLGTQASGPAPPSVFESEFLPDHQGSRGSSAQSTPRRASEETRSKLRRG